MKQMKRFFALLLMAVLALSMSMTAYAKKDDDDEEQDYSVSDVYFDVSDSMILVGWTVGDSECKYSVQLYDNKDLKAKHKVGSSTTVSYNAEQCDVTQRILNHGSGTYYAVVTAKKKAKGDSSYASAVGKETIYSEDLSTIRKNVKSTSSESTETTNKGNAGTGAKGPGEAAPSTTQSSSSPAASTGTGAWEALSDGRWIYRLSDGSAATGWYSVNGVWYYSGADGIMWASQWVESVATPGVWYYVDESGAMLTNVTRAILVNGVPVNYQFDADGVATISN